MGIRASLVRALSSLNKHLAQLRASKIWQLPEVKAFMSEGTLLSLGALPKHVELAHLGLGELAEPTFPIIGSRF